MLVECQNCGAPLQTDGSKAFVDCRYCGRSNKVASSKTLMAQVPAGWQPPAQWTPEMQRRVAHGVAASTAGAAGAGVTGCVVVSVVVAILGVVAAVVVTSLVGVGTSDAIPLELAPSWDGSAPFSCGGNDEVRIEGVHASLPGQTAIRATLNCDVTIVGSEITAARGIEASGNGTVRLENTTVRASETGIVASMNKRVVLVNSQIIAGAVGVDASGNANVTIEGGHVEGSPVAVRTGQNGEVINHGGDLVDRP